MKERSDKMVTRIFDFIKSYIEKNQKPPTVREIAGFFGFSSTSTVAYYLKKLQKLGYITLEGRSARNIKINEEAPSKKKLPLVGVIRAGIPVKAEENIEAYIDLDDFIANKGDFLLRVKGDSMKDAGILEGDLVLVRQTPTLNPGEIGVFLVDDEATVKRFQLINGRIALIPENKNYEPIFPESLMVVGKVTAVIRDLDA